MPQADDYEPGSKPTKTTGRVGESATGSNAGPSRHGVNEDAIAGTTSGVPPKHAPQDAPRDQKPSKGSRFETDA